MGVIVVAGNVAPFPLAPTLLSPTSGTYEDLASGGSFTWQYNPGGAGGFTSQTGWIFERLTNGGNTPYFWNATTGTWSATAVVNTNTPAVGTLVAVGNQYTYTFPAGAWVDGNSYQWAIVCGDANGTSVPSGYALIVAQQAPVVTLISPVITTTIRTGGTLASFGSTLSLNLTSGAGTGPGTGAISTSIGMVGFRYTSISGTTLSGVTYNTSTALSGITAATSAAVTLFVNTVPTACPIVAWTTTFAPGTSQLTWQVCIYTAAQQSIAGFTPGVSPSTYDSTAVGSNATSLNLSSVPLYMPTGTSYWAYVQVTETNNLSSAWAYTQIIVSYTAPSTAVPTATASTDGTTGCPCVRLGASVGTWNSNLLPYTDTDPQTTLNTGTWHSTLNCTVNFTVSATNGIDVSSTATTAMKGSTETGVSACLVTPGVNYTAVLNFKTAATVRGCQVSIEFFNAAGASLGSTLGGSVNDSTSAFTQGSVSMTAPANSVYATVGFQINSTAASEHHWVSKAGIWATGTANTWSIPGTFYYVFQRSDGLYVRNASSTTPGVVNSFGIIALYDYEVFSQSPYTYSLQTYFVASYSGYVTASALNTSGSVTVVTTAWWEFDPTDPSTAFEAQVVTWEPQVTEQSAAHLVMGQATPNIVASTMGGMDGLATFETFDPVTYGKLQGMLIAQTTYFLSSPWGATDSGYVRFGPATGGGAGVGSGNKVNDSTLLPSTYSGMHRTTSVQWVAQARPPV